MSEYPKVMYHKDGAHQVVASHEAAKRVGDGWSDKPNEKTERALRKASGAAKTDLQPGYAANPTEVF